MKITFEGTASEIKEEMTSFLLIFPRDTLASTEVREDHRQRDGNPFKDQAPGNYYPPNRCKTVDLEVGKSSGELIAQEGETACRFCAQYSGSKGYLVRHERYCYSNPQRVPDPRSGTKRVKPGMSSSERSEEPKDSLAQAGFNGVDRTLHAGKVGI